MRTASTWVVIATSVLVLAGCGDPESTAEPAETPSSSNPQSDSPSPSPDDTGDSPSPSPDDTGDSPSPSPDMDPWLQEARGEYLLELGDWYKDYYAADCVNTEPTCYDLFESGIETFSAYSDYLAETRDAMPDYVPVGHAGEVARAVRTLEAWSYACPDEPDCEEFGTKAGSRAFQVLEETSTWDEE